MSPRVKLYLNSTSGTQICVGTGSALTTSLTSFSFNCPVNSNITINSSDIFVLWVGVNLSATTNKSVKAQLNVDSTANDSKIVVPAMTPAPSITSATPGSGIAGTSVTVGGSSFGTPQGSGTITFNGVVASVSSWNDGSIGTTVPTTATSGQHCCH